MVFQIAIASAATLAGGWFFKGQILTPLRRMIELSEESEQPDWKLPEPEKRFHAAAKREWPAIAPALRTHSGS